MKNKVVVDDDPDVEPPHPQSTEILKAVAQAWYSHSGHSRPITEFQGPPTTFTPNPSRFYLQATSTMSMNMNMNYNNHRSSSTTCSWDFNESLWDSYELVAVSRRLETSLDLDLSHHDDPFAHLPPIPRRLRKESKNSLRNLFNQISSRRFTPSSPN